MVGESMLLHSYLQRHTQPVKHVNDSLYVQGDIKAGLYILSSYHGHMGDASNKFEYVQYYGNISLLIKYLNGIISFHSKFDGHSCCV